MAAVMSCANQQLDDSKFCRHNFVKSKAFLKPWPNETIFKSNINFKL